MIICSKKKVFDGFLYYIELEIITEWELIVYDVEVFKDMGEELIFRSYVEKRRRWRPDKNISKEKKKKIRGEL